MSANNFSPAPLQTQTDSARRWLFANCEYLERSRQLLVQGQEVKLEPKPLLLLEQFLENPNQIHTKEALLEAVWPGTWTTDQSLTTAINKLRNAFAGDRDQILRNVSGKGYRMAATVTCLLDSLNTQPQTEPAFHLEPGDPIPNRPHWRALRPLTGGVASQTPMVWLGEHSKTHEEHVFKFAIDGIALHALQREVSLSRFLKQSLPLETRFVRIVDWDLENTPYVLETEYSGSNLLDWSQTDSFTGISLEARLDLLAELAEAIAAAHSIGILHNDLKPSNILALQTQSTSEWTIKVADLGIASLSQPERIRALQITYHDPGTGSAPGQATVADRSSLSGSAMYRAPEQYTGAAPSIQGDVYALGVLLYQIACGNFLASLSPGWEEKIPDPLLRADIAAAANIDPAHRLQTASELAHRLRNLKTRRLETQKRDAQALASQQALKALEAARLRRPFVALAIGILIIGLFVSTLFYVRASRARDLAQKQNELNTAIVSFLSNDLLGQGNPFRKGSSGPQPTLLQAIDSARPQIDVRFHDQPQLAAQLHETIAKAFVGQTNFKEADREFDAAATRFRQAEGPLSQNAIVTELERESVALSSNMPGALENANSGFRKQKALAAQLKKPSPELTTWFALTQAAIDLTGPHPEQSAPQIEKAIQTEESADNRKPGTNPTSSKGIVLLLRSRLTTSYIRAGDGKNAESAARQYIEAAKQLDGPESPGTLWGLNNLQEALMIEAKNKEAIDEMNQNYPRFVRLLGPSNVYSLQLLLTRAEAEGKLKQYDAAIQDDLTASNLARANPSAAFFHVGGLLDASTSECRNNKLTSGIEHAREGLKEIGNNPGTYPGLLEGAKFNLAECLLAQQEITSSRPNPAAQLEIKSLLSSLDPVAVAHLAGDANFPAYYTIARARLASLQNQPDQARELAAKAQSAFRNSAADPYEKETLQKLESSFH